MSFRAKRYKEPIGEEVVGTVAELFAGVGGFRIGLSRSGWKTVFSNQWEPSTKAQHASDCYTLNFGAEGHSNEDIVSLVERHAHSPKPLIPKTDLLVGGFPCQDYSVAKSRNSSKGLEGKKGVLWWSIRDLVKINRPKYVFLENVDRLLKSPASQKGRDFAIMLHTLSTLGYLIEWRVVNAAEYGFPQRRIRVFIVATKTGRKVRLQKEEALEIIGRSGVLARALPVKNITDSLHEIDISASPEVLTTDFGIGLKKSPFFDSGVVLGGKAFTIRTQPKFSGKKFTLADVLASEEDVTDEFWVPPNRVEEWEYLKGAKSIARIHKASGTEYSYTEGKMAFPDLLTNPSRTILTGEGGGSPSRFKHIIKQGKHFRRLVPLELERLNGFPDHFTELGTVGPVSDARRAFFMGNALVVGLIERVGEVLAKDLASGRDK
jgi:DNA (cytosine-5)-methyltransferase 1